MPKQQRTSKAVAADHEERGRWGRLPSAYRAILGDSPKCRPGDTATAREFLEKIEKAIGEGGWTPAEADRLYRLRKTWRRRAEGADERFNLRGTRPGPPPDHAVRREHPDVEGLRKLLDQERRRLYERRREERERKTERTEGHGIRGTRARGERQRQRPQGRG